MPPSTAFAFRERALPLMARAAGLLAVAASEQAEADALRQTVAKAKGRLALAPDAGAVFEALQARATLRSVGTFERLLTAIMDDVLPGQGAIRLVPQYKGGTTWLDVLLERPEGLEDLLDANGGALTNVASAGLVFAALSRTANRKFVVLDEPDCWLKPDRVGPFLGVIADVSDQAGFQTVFVTHHNLRDLEGRISQVRLCHDSATGRVRADALQPLAHEWGSPAQPGIRAMTLRNFRAHTNTTIPLFPGATALTGDNNVGKSSALVAAFRAICYGESDDTMIRHGEDQATVVVQVENGLSIEWERRRKKSPAVMYRLWEGKELRQESRQPARGKIPDWAETLLRIGPVDGLDIQIRNQKEPVFLLNEPPSRRAQILSVGKEAGYLTGMMQGYRKLQTADQETARHGEARLSRLTYRAELLEPVPELNASVGMLMATAEAQAVAAATADAMRDCLRVVERGESVTAALSCRLGEVSAAWPVTPALGNTAPLEALVARLGRKLAVHPPTVPELPRCPELQATERLVELGQRITKGQRRTSRLLPAMPVLPALAPVEDLSDVVVTLSSALTRSQAAATAARAELESLEQAQAELNKLLDDLGSCPLCGAAFHHHATAETAHA